MRLFDPFITPYIRWFLACPMLAMALLAGQAFAAEVARVDLTATAEYLEDAQGTLTLAEVAGQAASRFAPMADVNLG